MSMRFTPPVAIALCAVLTSVPAQAQTANSVVAEIKSLRADLVQGRACKWLLPFDEAALIGKIADDAARARASFGTQAGNAADAAARVAAKAEPCNTPSDQQKQTQVLLLRLEYLARADALYETSEGASFGKDMTTLGTSQAIRTVEYNRLRTAFIANAGAGQWDPVYAGILGDARATIGLVCADRAMIRTKDTRKCPVVSEAAQKFILIAIAQLKSVEGFATAYENAAKSLAIAAVVASSDAANFWKATSSSASSTTAIACAKGDKVVDFNGPDVQKGKDGNGRDIVVAPVIAFGNPVEIGTVTAAPNGTDFVLLSADDKAKAAGVAGSMVFKHCSPA